MFEFIERLFQKSGLLKLNKSINKIIFLRYLIKLHLHPLPMHMFLILVMLLYYKQDSSLVFVDDILSHIGFESHGDENFQP